MPELFEGEACEDGGDQGDAERGEHTEFSDVLREVGPVARFVLHPLVRGPRR
ncbi:hypothetical protein AB0N31_26725 [Streptomyces sp. NPDC051051]|uniref:hypothetical protein n=1 Tax=Streptomyces sp. NPDC051051 TaxID=3155666 RepID=UPI003428D91A